VLRDAIEHYHDLLTDDLAAESQARLDRLQRQRNLMFGPRPLAAVLRPRFLTPEQHRFLCDRVQALLPALDKVYRAALADDGLRRQFGLTEAEEELVRLDPGIGCCWPVARLDGFLTPDNRLRFTEFSADAPAGAGYNDALTEVFLGLPVLGEFRRRYHVRPLPVRPGVLHGLLGAYRRWRGRAGPPHIAILDWRNVPTYSEFLVFQEYFRGQGFDCVIADPRELEYRDGRLYAGAIALDLLYRRVLTAELLERGGFDQPVVRAVRDGAVCMVNPFRCKLLDKKASFAVLSDERNEGLFTATERQAVTDHIPWTRRVQERRTRYAGREIDLVPFVLANRERLVLKPNDDYGGKGVVLGNAADGPAWERAVRQALASPYVVQERVDLPAEPYPSFAGGRVQLTERVQDTAPYVGEGAFADGCLTRLTTAALVNLPAEGGSTVPTFLVEKR
jgi:uncharacterized circularly permuted ATP-grasp superfamily protein